MHFFVGTYTAKKSKGIYLCDLNPENGSITSVKLVAKLSNPTYLTISPCGNYLYSVSEIRDEQGRHNGLVNAYKIQRNSNLSFINSQPARGIGPCHISTDRTGKLLFVANYVSGSVSAFPLSCDNGIGELCFTAQHNGKGKDKQRQDMAHAHSVNVSPDNKFLYVADLGTDRVMIYKIIPEQKLILPNRPLFVEVKAGSGPRHMLFSADDRNVYLVNELSNTVMGFSRDKVTGKLTLTQTIEMIHEKKAIKSYAADIVITPDGRYIYASVRENDGIFVFYRDQKSGQLSMIHRIDSISGWPRALAISPCGNYLIAAGQNNDMLAVFRVHDNGIPVFAGSRCGISMPVCIKFICND